MGQRQALELAGALASLVVAVALFTRFGINGQLARDEGIYTYGGIQLAHGVAPYASIFDPKGPLATMIAGAAALLAQIFSKNEVYAIRAAFFALSCVTVLAVYLLGLRLFRSTLAGLTAAVVFASFRGFAADALSGPDAKTPGVLLIVVAMLLMSRRMWFWGAFAGSLAFLVWQPFFLVPGVAVLLALLVPTGRQRVRSFGLAAAGAVIPVAVTVVYFAIVGALPKFIEAALVYPLTGVQRTQQTVLMRFEHIAMVVRTGYMFSGRVFWLGLVLLAALAVLHLVRHRRTFPDALREPLVSVVALTGLMEFGYALTDFQGYPDLYALLPYAALGVGGGAAAVLALVRGGAFRNAVTIVAVGALAVLTAFSWTWFTGDLLHQPILRHQKAQACAVERLLTPGRPLYALGDAVPLILTNHRNPDRFIYLDAGVDQWHVNHLQGGFRGWVDEIRRANPSVIVVHGWNTQLRLAMGFALRHDLGYHKRYAGTWAVYLDDAGLARAQQRGVLLTRSLTRTVTGFGGRELHAPPCR